MPTTMIAISATTSSVSSWQQSLEPASHVFDPDQLATVLYQDCLEFIIGLVKDAHPNLKSSLQHRLRTQAQKLKLWGSDHNADKGRLDVLLSGAPRLKSILFPIFIDLTDALISLARGLALEREFSDRCSRLRSLKVQALEAIPQKDSDDTDASILDELSSFGSENSSPDEAEELEGLVKDAHFHVDCLYGLSLVLRESAEQVDKENENARHQEISNQTYHNATARPYVANIIDAYPLINKNFAQRLGEANERRYKRLMDSRNNAAAAEDHFAYGSSDDDREEDTGPVPEKSLVETTPSESTVPSTQLSSLFDQNHRKPRPKATASVTSFASSADDPSVQRRTRGIPKMPDNQPWGQPFKCTVCGEKLSTVWSTAKWVKHVYRDLQPYICTFGDTCSQADYTFTSRHQWADHEFSEHRHRKMLQHEIHQIPQEKCPFCLTCPATTRAQLVSHVGRHMQDVSHAAIPMSALTNDQEELEVSDEEESDAETGTSMGKMATEPYFVVPPGFRANTLFVGRELELQQLDQYFFVKRVAFDTVSLLLHGPPGVGKTHLVRQFVFQSKSKYPGGIFWTSASSVEQMERFYWQIQNTLVDPDAIVLDHGNVKKWLEDRRDWLLIFDNVGKDVDPGDYIPELGLGCNILYTARDSNFGGQSFNRGNRRPIPIHIEPFSEEESIDLLFKELKLTTPTEVERKKAIEIVRETAYLPLAIHALGQRLSDTQQPLSKISLRDTIHDVTAEPYRHTLEDLQKHHADAWNIFTVLCWFANGVPVEMIRLGYENVHDGDSTPTQTPELARRRSKKSIEFKSSLDVMQKYTLISGLEPEVNTFEDPLLQITQGKAIIIHSVIRRKARDLQSEVHYTSLELAAGILNSSYYIARDVVISNADWEVRLDAYKKYQVQVQSLVESTDVFEMEPDAATRTKGTLQRILASIKNDMWEIHLKTTTEGASASKGIGVSVQTSNIDSQPPGISLPSNTFGELLDRPGLLEVSSPFATGHNIDIVFIHGLYHSVRSTWTSDKSDLFWPADLLPPFVKEEKARIMIYSYFPNNKSGENMAADISDAAERLLGELVANRRVRKASERPVIFVAHSLGGLVVKKTLIDAWKSPGQAYASHLRSLFVSTFGIVFLGTPQGSLSLRFSDFQRERSAAPRPNVSEDVKLLGDINIEFEPLMSRFHVYCFSEAEPTHFDGYQLPMVDVESASPTIEGVERASINADHDHMCRFDSEDDTGFELVVEAIQRYAGEAPAIIQDRWKAEHQMPERIKTNPGDNESSEPATP